MSLNNKIIQISFKAYLRIECSNLSFEEMKSAVVGEFNAENLMRINVENIKHDFEASNSLEYLQQIKFLSSCLCCSWN